MINRIHADLDDLDVQLSFLTDAGGVAADFLIKYKTASPLIVGGGVKDSFPPAAVAVPVPSLNPVAGLNHS